MKSIFKTDKEKRNAIVILFISLSVATGVFGYSMYRDNNNLMVQTDRIMDQIPNDCYVFFNGDHNSTNSDVIFYPEMLEAINKTGMKNLFPFERSATFHMYLFENCPYIDVSKHPLPKSFNASLGEENTLIKVSQYIKDQAKKEQQLHDFGIQSHSDSNTRMEQFAGQFDFTLPQIVDRLFLENAVDIDQCTNPSWKANSTLRQCTFESSHFLVDKNTQALIGILDAPPMPNSKKS